MASGSKARKEILNILGLKFKVFPSTVKEVIRTGRLSYAALVKKNALAKAVDVAKRVKGGVIIGADTIVVQGRKIFGKPRDLKDAHKMLKKLSEKPQWIYTGIAIIHKDKGRAIIDFEKTKVIMDKLSEREIGAYFRQVSPLDKAGSFDIQGKGAFFIRRIEGCFYNVVGLPLRKLYQMLKRLDIRIFFVCLFACLPVCLSLCGCSTEYNIVTGKQETYFYSTDREVLMGRAITKHVEKEYKPAEDPLIQAHLDNIGKKISSVCDRKEIAYHFRALEDEEVNAFALPGGFIYVNKGLIDKVSNDDELAAVLAHEVGHIVARHSIKKLQAMMGYSILRILFTQVPGSGEVGAAADAAFTEILLGYSRDDELLADKLGARYSRLAGYNPRAMVSFLEKLQEINRRKPPAPKSYFKTHPYVPDRIRTVKEEVGEKITFNDYINIEEKKGE